MRMMPQDARIGVRQREYKNQADELAAVRQVDQQVFDGILVLERHLLEQADELTERHNAALEDATAIRDELRSLNTNIDRKRIPMDAATARHWQTLSQRADEARETLARIDTDINHVATQLEDPEAAYTSLLQRFWILRPHIQF